MKFSRLIALGLISLLSSCGYHLQGSGSILPPDVKRVAIQPAENFTTEAGLGLKLTEKLRSRFERYGVVDVVEVDEQPDAELFTRIISVQTSTRNTTGVTDIELELDLVLSVSVELRRANGQVLYLNPALVKRESFASTSDVVVTSSSSFSQSGIGAQTLSGLGSREVSRGQQEQVLEELLDDVARSIYINAVAADF